MAQIYEASIERNKILLATFSPALAPALVQQTSRPIFLHSGGQTKSWIEISVTRFGEISPLWRNYVFGNFFEGIFNIQQNCEPTLATFNAIGQKLIVVKGTNIVILIEPSGHTY